jgi:hypothetical protein
MTPGVRRGERWPFDIHPAPSTIEVTMMDNFLFYLSPVALLAILLITKQELELLVHLA